MMKLKIFYAGDLGRGQTTVTVSEAATCQEVIEQFHHKIGKSSTYTIRVGAPPDRRAISVGYNYLISVNDKVVMDNSNIVGNLTFTESDEITIKVSGSGKVD